MHALAGYLDVLCQQAHPDGGWGYAPGQAAQLEPTCFGILALSLAGKQHQAVIDKARGFLAQWQGHDGSYRVAHGRPEAIWPTSLVLFTLINGAADASRREADVAQIQKSVAFLLGIRGKVPKSVENGELHDIDLKLTGWPWAENNFSWVEPTAWACLALRGAGQGAHPRVREGLKLLIDRAMDEGGINYGNRRILGRLTEPIPGPTALMLLAMQGEGQKLNGETAPSATVSLVHPRVSAACGYLMRQVHCGDLEQLCWIKLALDLYRAVPGVEDALPAVDAAIVEAHKKRLETPWLQPAPMRQALMALALGVGHRNVFRLTGQAATGEDQDKATSSPSSLIPHPSSPATRTSPLQRFGTWFRGLAVRAAGSLRPLPEFPGVHIANASDYNANLAEILEKQFEHFRDRVPLKGKRVVLKPNLVEYHRDKVINTNPQVVSAVIELCKRQGASAITVAEGPGHWRNVEYLVSASGLGDVLKAHGVPFVDLNHDEPVKTPNLGRLTGLEYLYLARTIADAEVLISLPKLKTHHWAGATLSLKNLFGTLPGICYGWPKNELHWRGIDNSIVDIALTRTPDLAIVDGIVGMEGDGPLNGTAKPFGALIMGHDLVAVDATCCRLMMLDPDKIAYLRLAHIRKLGRLIATAIPQLGESIASLAQPFETVPHLNELRVRKSA
jgi:uncharacterized protein (DUF362 family)